MQRLLLACFTISYIFVCWYKIKWKKEEEKSSTKTRVHTPLKHHTTWFTRHLSHIRHTLRSPQDLIFFCTIILFLPFLSPLLNNHQSLLPSLPPSLPYPSVGAVSSSPTLSLLPVAACWAAFRLVYVYHVYIYINIRKHHPVAASSLLGATCLTLQTNLIQPSRRSLSSTWDCLHSLTFFII